jgi:Domain of unknown function (DUF5615)
MREYRFLIDNDSQSAAVYFPEKRVVTLAQAKLSQAAPDSEVVAAARELECVIVTANGTDFEREIKQFLQRSQRKDCFDLFGLVVIPNAAAIQARVLPGLSDKLRFNGKQISWDDVWLENYLVSVHADGSVDVRELGRCFYCKKLKDNE